MPPFVFITTQIMLFLGVYLIVMGWTGVISGTAFVDRSPFSLRRPTTYLLVAWVIFLKPLTSIFGEPVAQGVFLLIGAIVIIETVRPLVGVRPLADRFLYPIHRQEADSGIF